MRKEINKFFKRVYLWFKHKSKKMSYYTEIETNNITNILNSGMNTFSIPFSFRTSTQNELTYNYHKNKQVQFRIILLDNKIDFLLGNPDIINLYDLQEELTSLVRVLSKHEDFLLTEFKKIYR